MIKKTRPIVVSCFWLWHVKFATELWIRENRIINRSLRHWTIHWQWSKKSARNNAKESASSPLLVDFKIINLFYARKTAVIDLIILESCERWLDEYGNDSEKWKHREYLIFAKIEANEYLIFKYGFAFSSTEFNVRLHFLH